MKKIKSKNSKEFPNLKPWNSGEDTIKVNSIRYNNDYTLLVLGTSKGYRIFSTSDLKLCNEIFENNINFGDISQAMVYYNSPIIFLLPSQKNEKYSSKELIVFDDYFQVKLGSFKDKKNDILHFMLSKNVLFLITSKQIIVLELFTFKIIDIIDNFNLSFRQLSFTFYDMIGYTDSKDKRTVYIKNYINENYKIISQKTKIIKDSTFNFLHGIQFSPLGDLIALVSVLGNKIHIYNTQNGKLKECIFSGKTVQTIEKLSFSEKKPNYLFILNNIYKFYVYKIAENQKCICKKYEDKNLINGEIDEQVGGILGFMRKSSKNKDIKEVHAYSEYNGRLLFADFNRNTHKNLIIIKLDGELSQYHFNKKKLGKISPFISFKWM